MSYALLFDDLHFRGKFSIALFKSKEDIIDYVIKREEDRHCERLSAKEKNEIRKSFEKKDEWYRGNYFYYKIFKPHNFFKQEKWEYYLEELV